MKKNLAIASGVALLFASGAYAQTETTGARQDGSRGPITVTGCLQSGGADGTTGSATSAATTTGAGQFTLMNVKRSGSTTTSTTAGSTSAPISSPTTGGTTAGSTTAAGTTGTTARNLPTSIALQGDDAQLRPHVGHQIEITGTMAADGTNNSGSAAASTTGGTSTTAGGTTAGGTTAAGTTTTTGAQTAGQGMRGAGGVRTMRVESVKMIASSCAEK
jgi:hypothetical protein